MGCQGFIIRHPSSRTPKKSPWSLKLKIPKDPPLLVSECIRVAIYKNPGFPYPGVSQFRKRELTEFCGELGEFCKKARWVRFSTQIIAWEELTELSPRNSVRAEKLTELGVWNRALRNRARSVSECRSSLAKLRLENWHLPQECV